MVDRKSKVNDYRREMAAMTQAAREAGGVIRHYFRLGHPVATAAEVRNKSADRHDFVTKADLEANEVLWRWLGAGFPDYGWLSEETMDRPDRLACSHVWVVDPLDGTRELVAGIPELAVSIALVVAGEPILACIYNPITDALFTAERHAGSYRNGQRLQVSTRTRLPGAHGLSSRSERSRGHWEQFQGEWQLTAMGSIAHKLALLATGGYDFTFTLAPKNEWDFCAGALVVAEAGGRVSDREGQPFRFNQPNPLVRSVVSTNGRLHDSLVARLEGVPLLPGR